MTKEERIEYMKSQFPKLEKTINIIPNQSDIVIPASKFDLEEEATRLAAIGEYQKEKQGDNLLTDEQE